MRTMRGAACAVLVGLLSACGDATSTPVADPESSPSSTVSPSPATSPPEPSSTVRPLDQFPLAHGYPETNGDDGSRVEVTSTSGVADLVFCDGPPWSPEASGVPPVDLVGATYTGEAEDSRGRTLARYPEAHSAQIAWSDLWVMVQACPEDSDGDFAQVHALTERDVAEDAFLITTRFRGPYGFDTGLVLVDVVRVGDLLLLNWGYGEGGGSASTIRASTDEVTTQTDALVAAMRGFAGGGE